MVQYHPFPDCCVLEEHEGQRRSSVAPPSSGSSSRSWRSHSLTPTTPSNSVSEAEWAIQKARSNSLTFGAKDHQHGRSGPVLNASTGVVGSSSELDAGGGGSGAIEEIIGRLPEGSGMRGKEGNVFGVVVIKAKKKVN